MNLFSPGRCVLRIRNDLAMLVPIIYILFGRIIDVACCKCVSVYCNKKLVPIYIIMCLCVCQYS